jgi:S-adenosylmethionine-diacylgycerolhomoserine-N-methlytransferase
MDMAAVRGAQSLYKLPKQIERALNGALLPGRRILIEQVAAQRTPKRVLVIGQWRAADLDHMRDTFPRARLTLIAPAHERERVAHTATTQTDAIRWLADPYSQPVKTTHAFDLALVAYELSHRQLDLNTIITALQADLRPGGLVAVVDFHDAPFPPMQAWLRRRAIEANGHLLPILTTHFKRSTIAVEGAHGGLWRFLLFLGENR